MKRKKLIAALLIALSAISISAAAESMTVGKVETFDNLTSENWNDYFDAYGRYTSILIPINQGGWTISPAKGSYGKLNADTSFKFFAPKGADLPTAGGNDTKPYIKTKNLSFSDATKSQWSHISFEMNTELLSNSGVQAVAILNWKDSEGNVVPTTTSAWNSPKEQPLVAISSGGVTFPIWTKDAETSVITSSSYSSDLWAAGDKYAFCHWRKYDFYFGQEEGLNYCYVYANGTFIKKDEIPAPAAAVGDAYVCGVDSVIFMEGWGNAATAWSTYAANRGNTTASTVANCGGGINIDNLLVEKLATKPTNLETVYNPVGIDFNNSTTDATGRWLNGSVRDFFYDFKVDATTSAIVDGYAGKATGDKSAKLYYAEDSTYAANEVSAGFNQASFSTEKFSAEGGKFVTSIEFLVEGDFSTARIDYALGKSNSATKNVSPFMVNSDATLSFFGDATDVTVTKGKWYRTDIVLDTLNASYTAYLNGKEIASGTVSGIGLDGGVYIDRIVANNYDKIALSRADSTKHCALYVDNFYMSFIPKTTTYVADYSIAYSDAAAGTVMVAPDAKVSDFTSAFAPTNGTITILNSAGNAAGNNDSLVGCTAEISTLVGKPIKYNFVASGKQFVITSESGKAKATVGTEGYAGFKAIPSTRVLFVATYEAGGKVHQVVKTSANPVDNKIEIGGAEIPEGGYAKAFIFDSYDKLTPVLDAAVLD